jgi:hypothetical protein
VSADGWIPLDEATGAFERPAWAIRALLEQGKLERKVEDGRVYVRKPVANAAPRPTDATTEGLAAALAALLPADSFIPAEEALEAIEPEPRETRTYPVARADAALPATESWDDIRADVDELMRKTRARDALLARAAQALLFVEAGMRQAPPVLPPPAPPLRARSFAPTALVVALLLAGSVGAKLGLEAITAERVATGRALERAAAAERECARASAPVASVAPVTTSVAPVASSNPTRVEVAATGSQSTTLPAGFGR